MTRTFDAHGVTARYAPLGLISNPFFGSGRVGGSPEGREVTSQSNALLQALMVATTEQKSRPIWVTKSDDIPDAYHSSAESRLEAVLAQDDDLSILHAYIPLFAMKSGAVRSTLGLLGERLIFRQFDRTLALYVERILAEPDESLASYKMLGPEALEAFRVEFDDDPLAAIHATLGTPERERQPQLAEVADMRQLEFDGDVDEAPSTVEVDETVGDAPGTVALMANRLSEHSDSDHVAVADYLIEYTREHLSPVIGRALRVYQDRGLTATVAELKVTKAPRKTLAAVARLASVRYRKIAIIYDGFANWLNINADLRSKITGLLSEIRWALADDAVLVFLAEKNRAPELEEPFGSGTRLEWDFPGLIAMEKQRGAVLEPVISGWLANAARPGTEPMTAQSPGVAAAIEAAEGSLQRFVALAATAVELAADEAAAELTPAHVAAAVEELDSEAAASEQGVQ